MILLERYEGHTNKGIQELDPLSHTHDSPLLFLSSFVFLSLPYGDQIWSLLFPPAIWDCAFLLSMSQSPMKMEGDWWRIAQGSLVIWDLFHGAPPGARIANAALISWRMALSCTSPLRSSPTTTISFRHHHRLTRSYIVYSVAPITISELQLQS